MSDDERTNGMGVPDGAAETDAPTTNAAEQGPTEQRQNEQRAEEQRLNDQNPRSTDAGGSIAGTDGSVLEGGR